MQSGNTTSRAKSAEDRDIGKQKLLVFSIAGVLIAVGGAALFLRPSTAEDTDSLQKQRAAAGMPDRDAMRARMMNETAQTLGLSDAQKEQFAAAQEADMPKMREIFEDKSLRPPQKMAKLQEMHAAGAARVRQLLTPDQQIKFDKMQAEMPAHMQQMMGRRGAGGSGMMAMPVPPGMPPFPGGTTPSR